MKFLLAAMLGFATLGGVGVALGSGQTDDDRDASQDRDDRKAPGMFHRAKQATPEEQMSYADDLVAKNGNCRKARRAYLAIVHNWHGSAEAAKAQLKYATLLEEKGSYRNAFDEFQYLMDHFPGDFPHQAVVDHQFRIANFVKGKRSLKILGLPGFSSPERAIPLLSKIVENAPEWNRAAELQFQIGLLHQEDGAYADAAEAYAVVLSAHGRSLFAADACYNRANCLRTLALRRRNNEHGLQAAANAFRDYLEQYPSHTRVESATVMHNELNERLAKLCFDRAVFYDRGGRHPKAAIRAYEELIAHFPDSPPAADARQRIAELEGEKDRDKGSPDQE